MGNTEFTDYKLRETQIKPVANYFVVILMLDDELEEPEVPKESKRVIGIDLGVDNIAAISLSVNRVLSSLKPSTIEIPPPRPCFETIGIPA